MVKIQDLQNIAAEGKFVPEFKSGQTVRVFEKIKEGDKTRMQVFEGLVIACGGQGAGRTITVRKIVGKIGVEKIFAVFSPNIEKFEITKEAKVRRAKLFFMRDRRGKSARLKEKFLTKQDLQKNQKPAEEKVTENSSQKD